MKYHILAGAVGLVLLCVGGPAKSQGDYEYSRATLTKLDSLNVHVTIDDDLLPYIQEERLRTIIELELRKAGIAVVGMDNTPVGVMLFDMSAFPIKISGEVAEFGVSVRCYISQGVTLSRDSSIRSVAATWELDFMCEWGINRVAEGAQGIARSSVEGFLNAYLAANPKQ